MVTVLQFSEDFTPKSQKHWLSNLKQNETFQRFQVTDVGINGVLNGQGSLASFCLTILLALVPRSAPHGHKVVATAPNISSFYVTPERENSLAPPFKRKETFSRSRSADCPSCLNPDWQGRMPIVSGTPKPIIVKRTGLTDQISCPPGAGEWPQLF